jgi:uncharacterized protein
MTTTTLRRALLVLVALLAACAASRTARLDAPPAPSPAGAPAPGAFLWEVTRPDAPDRPLLVTGSVHAGKPGQFALPPALEAALGRAAALVVEVDPARGAAPELQVIMVEEGFYAPGAPSLAGRLDGADRTRLDAAVQRAGLPSAAADRMRPWLLSTTLAVLDLQRAGYAPDGGVDALLLDRAKAAGKEIVELETAEGQLRMMAGLPDDSQLEMLREYLHEPDAAAQVGRLAEAWLRGDAEELARLVFEDAGDPAAQPLLETIFYARNRIMVDHLAPLVGAGRVHLAVVGAGHVVGERGVLALLTARGFQVRQVPRE